MQFTRIIESYSRLGGVGYNESDGRYLSQSQVFVEVVVRVHGTADAVDECERVYCLPVDKSLQVNVIHAILLVQLAHHALRNGLYDYYRTVESGAVVHSLHYPIDKRTKEVALAKLNNPFGVGAFGMRGAVEFLHNIIDLRVSEIYSTCEVTAFSANKENKAVIN